MQEYKKSLSVEETQESLLPENEVAEAGHLDVNGTVIYISGVASRSSKKQRTRRGKEHR